MMIYVVVSLSGKFVPEDLDASLCTHVIYAFSVLDEKSLTLKIFDQDVDVKQSKLAVQAQSLAVRTVSAFVCVKFCDKKDCRFLISYRIVIEFPIKVFTGSSKYYSDKIVFSSTKSGIQLKEHSH